jgi:drug/metabolite transporter (DMT)-like permease
MGRPSILPLVLIFVNVILGSIGQVTIRYGASRLGNLHSGEGITSSLLGALRGMLTPYVFFGLVLYALSAVIWIFVLNQVKLSFAYPMISLSYVLVVVLSALILHEKVPMVTIAGLVLISVGVSLIGIGYGSAR